jgi:hypothetical protein
VEEPAKLADYRRNLSYERRVVVFYDILGWRNHIAKAGSNSEKIGKLRRLILQFNRTIKLRGNLEIRASTFSDNVVISQKVSEKTQMLLQQMALFEVAGALNGYLLRGGITVGDIHHDEESVFGPGLNRAYELESKIAHFPRFILDSAVGDEYGYLGDLPTTEDGVRFLNPFTVAFFDHISRGTVASSEETLIEAGLPAHPNLIAGVPGHALLGGVLDTLKEQIRAPLDDKDWEKVAWLYDRIADQLGVPPARSYPRAGPPTK